MTTVETPPPESQVNRDLLRPLFVTGWRYKLAVAVLASLVAWGAYAFTYQLFNGLWVAGINRPVFWGIYIANFVFWIGISHAGVMVSAILRITQAQWRRPITRAAEAMTVFSLMIAGMFPVIHMGRNWLAYWLIPYPNQRGLWPNFRSPILWDITAITTYLIGSSLFLYVSAIPDFALVRDRTTGWRKRLYGALALGWRGTEREWSRLKIAIGIIAALIIPVFVSVHSIVSWNFAMTLVPRWHSTIFAPYFVVGAILSGVAAVVTLMALLRWLFHLEDYIRPDHFNNIGKLLMGVSLAWLYLWFTDFLVTWYGNEPSEMAILRFELLGDWAPLFWTMLAANFIIPFPLLAMRRVRTSVPAVFAVSLLINVGMFIERFLIIPGTLSHPRLPAAWGSYWPTWVELSITLGAFAGFSLLYLLFIKVVPIIPLWEVKEGYLARSSRRIAKAEVLTVSKVD